MKRIESIKRSPVYVHFDETLSGASSIRAYCQQDSFIAKNDRLVDENQMAWYPIIVSQRCCAFLFIIIYYHRKLLNFTHFWN